MNTENQQTESTTSLENKEAEKTMSFELTSEIINDLKIAGKWSQFLSILGFIGMGFMVVGGLGMSIAMSIIPQAQQDVFPFPMAFFGVLYIVMALVYLFPILYLYRFSAGIRQAFYKKNQEYLANAFTNLKSHYKSVGIIMIVFLCLYPILMVGMVVFGIFSGMNGADSFPI